MGGVERINLQKAYILHRRPYRESSLLLDVFTQEHGRLGFVARGSKRARNAQASLLQSFTPLLLSWSRRGELATLTDVEMAAPPWPLKGADLISGFYLNELLIRLLERDDPHPELFTDYAVALERLSASDLNSEWSLRLFEKSLLDALGYGLQLEVDGATGEIIDANTRYCYQLERGPISCDDRRDHPLMIQGATLLALEQGMHPESFMLREAKQLMRTTLEHYLGDRPLKSREVFRQTFNKQSAN